MAIKWKRWKNNVKSNIACIVFVLGVSMLITGGMGVIRQFSLGDGITSVHQMLVDSDYQNSRRFRDFIANRLENFLDMGCGDLIYDDYYGYYGYYGDYDYEEAIEDAIIWQEEQTYVSPEDVEEYDAAEMETELTEAQKKKIIQNLQKQK